MVSKINQLIKNHELSTWLLKVIALYRLLLGNYANISESRALCYLMKLYCICCCAAVSFFFNDIERTIFSLLFITSLEYVFTAVVYLIYSDKRFLHFFSAITTNDRIIGFKKLPMFTSYAYLILIGNLFARFGITVYRASLHIKSISFFCGVTFAVCSIDSNHLTVIIIFAILQSRMKQLRIFLESNSVPINITGRNEVAHSIKNIRKSLYNYNNLLDNLQYVDKQLQYLLFISWSSHCLNTIFLSYDIMCGYFIIESHRAYLVPHLAEIVLSVVMVSCPAVIAQAITDEVDQIKATLILQALRCSDESLRFELDTALQYVSLRPFAYTICRAVPLDIYLPFTVISLCITFFIVLIQLTHFSV